MSWRERLARRLPVTGRLLAERDYLLAENARLARRAAAGPPPPPPTQSPAIGALSTAVDPRHYLDPEWAALHRALERYAVDKHCFQHVTGEVYRKGWEWTHCVYGLRRLGALRPEAHGLGVGAGRECVIFYLATEIARVTATDLYGADAWSGEGGREADTALLEAARHACPPNTPHHRISFENEDGTRLSYADASFDFAWSLSSIEHFGGHGAAARAVGEMARVVRPGGVVAIATEMLLLEEYRHPEYFTRSEVLRELVAPHEHRLELVGPVDWGALPYDYLVDSVLIPHGAERFRRHVVLNDGAVQWTSLMLFFRVRA